MRSLKLIARIRHDARLTGAQHLVLKSREFVIAAVLDGTEALPRLLLTGVEIPDPLLLKRYRSYLLPILLPLDTPKSPRHHKTLVRKNILIIFHQVSI
jgi:hypothetical protein